MLSVLYTLFLPYIQPADLYQCASTYGHIDKTGTRPDINSKNVAKGLGFMVTPRIVSWNFFLISLLSEPKNGWMDAFVKFESYVTLIITENFHS